MERIKKKIKSFKEITNTLFSKFPITLIIVTLTTLIVGFTIGSKISDSKYFSKMLIFFVTFGIGIFFVETKFRKNKINIFYYAAAGVISGIFTCFFKYDINSFIFKLYVCYTFSITAMSIYFIYKSSNVSFEKYVTNIAVNIFKFSIVYVLISIGLLLISLVFVFLMLNATKTSFIVNIQVLILGLFYIPSILYSLCTIVEIKSKFIKAIIKNVLDILIIVAFAIIYLYIAKIIILRDMPSNQIYRITAVLFSVGLPVWTMSIYLKEDNLIDKINEKLPVLFIPFIFLQIYTISIRITNYGLTEARYLCVIFVVFEAIYITLYLTAREKIYKIIPISVILIVIALIVPVINMNDLSEISQVNNLKLIQKKGNLNDAEIVKIVGAYEYLNKADISKNIITQNEINKIQEYINDIENRYTAKIEYKIQSEFLNAKTDETDLNIDGYRKISKLSVRYKL